MRPADDACDIEAVLMRNQWEQEDPDEPLSPQPAVAYATVVLRCLCCALPPAAVPSGAALEDPHESSIRSSYAHQHPIYIPNWASLFVVLLLAPQRSSPTRGRRSLRRWMLGLRRPLRSAQRLTRLERVQGRSGDTASPASSPWDFSSAASVAYCDGRGSFTTKINDAF